MDLTEKSFDLIKGASKRMQSETYEETKKRKKTILDRRNQALEKVQELQKKSGMPKDDEIDLDFFNEADVNIDLESFRNAKNED